MAEELLEKARKMARDRHDGQTDRLGIPYFHHVEDITQRVAHLGPTVEIIAWLHDIVEDTETSLDEIEACFGAEIRAGVDAMTKRETEQYFEDYLPRLQSNRDAVAVKIADASHNWGKAHLLRHTDEAQTAYFEGKYKRVLEQLGVKTERMPEMLTFQNGGWTRSKASNK